MLINPNGLGPFEQREYAGSVKPRVYADGEQVVLTCVATEDGDCPQMFWVGSLVGEYGSPLQLLYPQFENYVDVGVIVVLRWNRGEVIEKYLPRSTSAAMGGAFFSCDFREPYEIVLETDLYHKFGDIEGTEDLPQALREFARVPIGRHTIVLTKSKRK